MISTQNNDSDQVVEHVISAILSNRLNPGVKLSEVSLQDEFGFSRNVVREGFLKLVDAGVLIHKKNQGVHVAVPTEEQTRQIFQARRIIENGIMQILLDQCIDNKLDIETIEKLIEEEEQLHRGGKSTELTQASCYFHLRLAELCNNQFLVDSLKPLILLSTLAASVYTNESSGFCSYEEHQNLFDSIKSQDRQNTIDAINIHLDRCIESLNFEIKPKAKTNYSHIFN
ncbi:MAG TPA: GntR family transcriptional regulator [Gammaproteobacteria bacterium]|jgi:DNA-binding GntR family transcriptional regulator|nr:GntR family transcriptional regulator [Gammaproteobacteria bacterium]